jgi:putative RNA 2'-phosphotransferase
MSQQKSPKRLAKLLDYILARRPDEFGLVTDKEGFIKVKDLLKALSEEEGLSYVRRGHLDEILITITDPSFEIVGNTIRAKNRQHLPTHTYAAAPPKLLYHCVRQKAYPHVAVKGINPTGHARVILSADPLLAERIGRRIDRTPVLLTVQVQECHDRGVVFFTAGEALFLVDFVPPDCFRGPPLPKEKFDSARSAKPKKPAQKVPAGSFFIDLEEKMNPGKGSEKQNKKSKKHKKRREPPPWRR